MHTQPTRSKWCSGKSKPTESKKKKRLERFLTSISNAHPKKKHLPSEVPFQEAEAYKDQERKR